MAKPANLRIEDVAAATARADLNDILISIASLQTTDGVGTGYTGEPTTTYPNMLWYDKTTDILKMRSEADDAWITVGNLDQAANTFAAAVALASQAEAEAGAENTKTMTALRTKQAIDALAAAYEDGEDATTSGSTHDFTGIPAGMNEIDIFLDSVSTTGTSDFVIQIGTGGVPTTTGYFSVSTDFSTNATSTSGFIMRTGNAARTYTASMQLRRIPGTNKWQAQHSGLNDGVTAIAPFGHGYGALAGTLDNIRLLTSSGTFDAGGWSIRCRK